MKQFGESKKSETKGRLIIHANNISNGGGKIILESLICELPSKINIIVQIDSRMMKMRLKDRPLIVYRYIKPTVLDRFKSEIWLLKNAKVEDTILCMGSLPPIFNIKGRVMVYVQNRYLIDKASSKGLSMKIRIRINIERLWLKYRKSIVDDFIVQTLSMKLLMQQANKGGSQDIYIKPFTTDVNIKQVSKDKIKISRINSKKNKYDFTYIASGERHKNHYELINAWCILADEKIFPTLCITIEDDKFKLLCNWIEEKKNKYNLKLENVGKIKYEEVWKIYSQSTALIYPSSLESLGLPLLEASRMGLDIVASELDFVRDIVDPEETFNPKSAVSIAKGVKRYLGMEDEKIEIISPKNFLIFIINNLK